jgi:hypothetical protein
LVAVAPRSQRAPPPAMIRNLGAGAGVEIPTAAPERTEPG